MISIEKLSHFNCSKCGGWWTIGDAKINIEYYCPWCGYYELHKKKDNKYVLHELS